MALLGYLIQVSRIGRNRARVMGKTTYVAPDVRAGDTSEEEPKVDKGDNGQFCHSCQLVYSPDAASFISTMLRGDSAGHTRCPRQSHGRHEHCQGES